MKAERRRRGHCTWNSRRRPRGTARKSSAEAQSFLGFYVAAPSQLFFRRHPCSRPLCRDDAHVARRDEAEAAYPSSSYVVVAIDTEQTQVTHRIPPAARDWHDVINRERSNLAGFHTVRATVAVSRNQVLPCCAPLPPASPSTHSEYGPVPITNCTLASMMSSSS